METISTLQIDRRIQILKPLPQVITRVLRISEDPNTPIQEVVQAIKLDEAITVRVLHLCNSPYYGLLKKVETVEHAVVYIGMNSLVNVLLTLVCGEYFRVGQGNYNLARGDLWKHSVATAIGSQLIGEKINYESPERLFTGGLLHDIGKLVLDDMLTEYIAQIRQLIEDGYAQFEAEIEVLGKTHCDVGAKLATKWELPPSVVEIIQHHHDPFEADEFVTECCIVHVVNCLVTSLGFGTGDNPLATKLSPGCA